MISLQVNNIIVPDNTVAPHDGALESLKGLSFDDAIAKIASSLVDFSFRLIIAILILYLGKLVIKKIYKTVRKVMLAREIETSLTTFILSLVKIVLYFILIVTIIGILGIETSSFLALFASAGVAIGMALSGTLQNFAGGVLILLLKPYKVGDFIEAQGYTGTVKSIQIFHTIINTTDNKAIIIPNGSLSTSSINNYSMESYRRVDWTVSLSYGTNLREACDALKNILAQDERIVKKYIIDDINRRKVEAEASQEDKVAETYKAECEETPEHKISFWQKIKCIGMRRHKKIQKTIQSIDAGISTDILTTGHIDCSPFAELNEMADSSINIAVRAWTTSANYWGVYFDMNRKFYEELPKLGFSFPFPQMDVHLNTVQ